LSTEQKKQSEESNAKGSEGVSLIGQHTSNQEPSSHQTAHPADHQRRFFRRLKDRINTHQLRELLTDPRAWLEIIALIVLMLYTYYSGKQWNVMRGQLDQMMVGVAQTQTLINQAIAQTKAGQDGAAAAKSAADTAAAALQDTKRSFELSTRPYIQVVSARLADPLTTSEPLHISFDIRNSGRSPAIIRGGTVGYYLFDPTGHSPRGEVTNLALDTFEVGDFPRAAGFFGLHLTESGVQYLITGTVRIRVEGSFPVYSPIFRKQYTPVAFCFYYDSLTDKTKLEACDPKTIAK
jgi:hypothetical protein